MKDAFKYGLILGLICFFASGILALVNGLTEPKINEQKQMEESSALKQVIPQARHFEPKLRDNESAYYLAYDGNGKLIGFIIKSEGKGYSSTIELFTGLNRNLEITNIKILFQNETPGLGSRIKEDSFSARFKGRTSGDITEVEAITGATISSRTIINSIKERIESLKEELLKELSYAK